MEIKYEPFTRDNFSEFPTLLQCILKDEMICCVFHTLLQGKYEYEYTHIIIVPQLLNGRVTCIYHILREKKRLRYYHAFIVSYTELLLSI